ncbi:cysteine--1-D-myo-inosityl 2-amino-2-deoxy-alpha-D-glucopyranoside ligase [Virgisporangium ochraceum]|uniref:L-cysteine:1D-myo-inositol 2-amino-2-deoxy-alpha-D-glucopyranoside ligase n=1 Tax=Virgisporangium ochraceum TaxID=65505 RepID=A0A8J4EFV0_9ACTN|nr:cysteine--1-D-myo-inosityl 2-amino-2-deoxy-alpha-D-glucopyranoside ligase [Virgisporangium ochraceum]GIJ73224.1 L-cysteine:1D-myo-inositol 2-amino-2-deoxy-alpha-D-glucopyranoside ligase [Virgisporangium ochraceum]
MDPWTSHDVPELPGRGVPLRLYDTARAAVAATGTPTMYVCGITPYDATHLGHAATMITFDLVNRVWRDNGHDVRYVQNVTDIDDPLLERAERDGEDWVVLAMRETALFREDMEALRIIPPAYYVGAVESIPRIAAAVVDLMEKGAAYRLDDGTGDVYFPISAAAGFGSESHYDRETMLALAAERGGDPGRAGKRDPLDPLLWRGARDGEPAWEGGPLGPGRPGWHVECAVIALRLLGDRIGVQGGGNDLIFPHHECSAAHAEVLTGTAPFAEHYAHAGMIGLAGEKMSKSRGNLVFVSRLRADGVDPMALRLALVAEHYRTDRQWTDDVLKTGQQRLARWREAAARGAGPDPGPVVAALRERLSDDLDTPGALAVVDGWAEATLSGTGDAPVGEVVAAVDALLGVRL